MIDKKHIKIYREIGLKIKERRLELKLTQDQLVKKINKMGII